MRRLVEQPAGLSARFGLPITYKLVGNLPYYLSAYFLGRLILLEPRPSRSVLTLQTEVADRLAARPPRMRFLSVLIQSRMRVRLLARVAPEAFFPPPVVVSKIISLTPHDDWQRDEFRLLKNLAAVAFRAPRKQIRNNLQAVFTDIGRQGLTNLLTEAAIDPSRRAETLNLAEWKKLVLLWKNRMVNPHKSVLR